MTSRLRERARQVRALAYRWLARASDRRVGIVLAYHGIEGEPGDRRREIVPSVDRYAFERQLRHLARGYTIVPPSSIQAAAAGRRRGARIPVALTFDDDLASHAREAAPILRRAGAVAAFFVCGASLDAPERFWWEDLQVALDGGTVDRRDLLVVGEDAVEEALSGGARGAARLAAAIEELAPATRAALATTLRERAGEPPPESGLRRAAVAGLFAEGHEIGFHTLRHDRLPPLSDEALDAALADGREALAGIVGHRLTTISYPHGRADDRVARAARRHGFVQGFTGTADVVQASGDALLVPRIEPTAESSGAFAVHVARFASGRARG